MTEREMKQTQEDRLYEAYLVMALIDSGKQEELRKHLLNVCAKGENGMAGDEINAVIKRAKEVAESY